MGVEHGLAGVQCFHHEMRDVIVQGQYVGCSLRVNIHLVLLGGEKGKCRCWTMRLPVRLNVLTLGFATVSRLLEKSMILGWRHSVFAEYAMLVVVGRCSQEGSVEAVLGVPRHLLEGRFRQSWSVTVEKE
jgi:hypothetical protein